MLVGEDGEEMRSASTRWLRWAFGIAWVCYGVWFFTDVGGLIKMLLGVPLAIALVIAVVCVLRDGRTRWRMRRGKG